MTFIFRLLLTLALALTSVPGEAATPVTACGEVLDATGDYQLTGNLGPCAGDGVVITASNATLDLTGFTITGVSSLQSCNTITPQYEINVTAAVTNVHIPIHVHLKDQQDLGEHLPSVGSEVQGRQRPPG
jgi:hypothetical protein